MKKFLLPLAAWVFLTSFVSAQIIVTNDTGATTVVDSGADQANKTTTFTSWSLSGGNTVAVFFSAEGQDLSSVQFGNAIDGYQNLIIVQETSGGRHSSAIAYLINPDLTTGDIVINWETAVNGDSNQNDIAYTPFALGGVGGVVDSDANDNGTNLNFSYTTSLDGGYVLGVATNNQFDGAPLPNISGNPDIFKYSSNPSGNFSTIHAHGDIASAGSYTDTYSGDLESAASIAFSAVPEPSAFALLAGCFGFTWVMLRRR